MQSFHYPLDALLRKQSWEIDMFRMELASLLQVQRQQEQEYDEIEKLVIGLQQELLARRAASMNIDILSDGMFRAYLDQQCENMLRKQQQLEQTKSLVATVSRQLNERRQEHKALENHKEHQHAAFQLEIQRRQQRDADADWMIRTAASMAGNGWMSGATHGAEDQGTS